MGHAEAHHRIVKGRGGGRHDLLAFVSKRRLADADGSGSAHRQVGQAKRRSMHHRKDRLRGALVVELEQ